MRTPKAIGTNPEILVKARENSGYNVDEVAKKLDKDTKILLSWEVGKDVPTFKQLSKLSKIYNFPSAFFFADEVPNEVPIPTDFRTMPNRTIENFPEIKREIKNANEKREIAIELIQRLNAELPEFTLECSINDDPSEVASMIRKYLDVTIEEQLKWKKDKYTALNKWKNILENKGILIFQFTGISPDEIRGYSLTEKPLPVIGINTGELPKTRNFSIFHELAHIISGTSGICDMRDRNKKIERFCDEVAAKFLVPPSNLLNEELVKANDSLYWDYDTLTTLSNRYGVSKEVILISLVKSKRSTWNIYRKIKSNWYDESEESEDSSNNKPYRIPYHVKVLSWNGNYYTQILFDAYHNHLINRHNLSNYMGDIKFEHIEKMGVNL